VAGRGLPASQGEGGRRRARWELILLVAATVVVLLPFAGKAFHIDDPLFVWSAQQIHREPLDFYGFEVNWYGTPTRIAEVTQNPPGTSYYLALAALLLGWSEVALHVAYLVPAAAAAVGTFLLARRFCSRPLAAALFVLSSPVFLMSATVLTSDLLMLAIWVWAVELWLRGIEGRRQAALGGSALLVGLAALTKYFAISLIPLLLVDAWARRRRLASLWLLLPVSMLALYELITRSMYGRGLLSQAGGYTSYIRRLDSASQYVELEKALVGVAFAGGCLLLVLLFAPGLWSRKQLAAGLIVGLAAAASLMWVELLYGYPLVGPDGLKWPVIAHLSVFLLAGLGVAGLAVARLSSGLTADNLLLSLWALGTLVFASVLNWTVNGRSVLPALPAIGILLLLRLEARRTTDDARFTLRLYGTMAAGLAIALAVTWADLRLAGAGREAARRVAALEESATGPIWFQGHWGFQWYMEQQGARALDLGNVSLPRGAILVLPENNTAVRGLPPEVVGLVDMLELPVGWVTTMSPGTGAAYYAARTRGPLPFAFGPAPPERYFVYRLMRRVSSSGPR
jgi:hypothetical protein